MFGSTNRTTTGERWRLSRRRRGFLASLVSVVLVAGTTTVAHAAAPLDSSTEGRVIGTNKQAAALRECPADQVVIGARAQNRVGGSSADGILVQFDLLCGSITLDAAGSPVVTRSSTWLAFPQFNEGRGNTSDGVCPTNQVAHQLSGSTFEGAARWTQSAILHCRPLTVTPDGELRVDRRVPQTLVTAGNGQTNPKGQRIDGPSCGVGEPELSTVVIRGYRPQLGGEGLDGYAGSCGTFGSDASDAPASYGGASHTTNAGTYLGALVDAEKADQPTAEATGDDSTTGTEPNLGVDDEDGVATLAPVEGSEGTSYTADVTATNRVSTVSATLVGWIDFDRDGTFDESEAATSVVPTGSVDVPAKLVWTGLERRVVASGPTFARVRIAVGTDLASTTPTGAQRAGEVEDYAVQLVAATPTLSLSKTVEKVVDTGRDGLTNTGDVLTYAVAVTNPSTVSLTDVAVSDALPGLGTLTPSAWPSGQEGVLRPGQTVTYRADYTVTQADTDRGSVTNTASAAARSPLDASVVAPDSSTTTPLDQTAALTLTKKGVLDTQEAEAGDEIDYTFTVTNTGSLTVTQTAITDPKPGLSTVEYDAWPGTPGSLAPGESVTATAHYTLTQADIDARTVENTATATGVSSAGAIDPVTSSVSVPVAARSEIAIDKTAIYQGGDDPKPGDRIAYDIEVSNVGATTATDVTVHDALPGLSALVYDAFPSGTPGVLAPGDSVVARGTYALTQSDIDAGMVHNTAAANARNVDDTPIDEVMDTADVDLNDLAIVTITKTAAFTGGSYAVAGESVGYTFTVKNDGNVTLTDVQVDDRLPRLSLITFGTWPGTAGELAPGESVTASANYAVTEADIRAQGVSNTATALATARTGSVVSEPAVAIVPLSPEPKIVLAATGAAPLVAGMVVLALLILGALLWFAARRRQARR